MKDFTSSWIGTLVRLIPLYLVPNQSKSKSPDLRVVKSLVQCISIERIWQNFGFRGDRRHASIPDGVETDDELAASALGITMREDTLESFEKIMEQQQGFFYAIQG